MTTPDYGRIRRLLPRIAAGDTTALGRVFDDLAPSVHAVVSAVVDDADLAGQVTAAVFVELWRTAGSCAARHGATSDNAVIAWAMTIAARHAGQALDTAETAGVTTPGGVPAGTPQGRRVALALALHTALTYRQVAGLLDISADVVAAHLRAALADRRTSLPVAVVDHA